MKTTILLACFFSITVLFGAEMEQYFLPSGTPLFQSAELTGRPVKQISCDMMMKGPVSRTVFHVGVMQKNVRVLRVSLPDGDFWAPLDIEAKTDPSTQRSTFFFLPNLPVMFSGVIALAAALLLLLQYYRLPEFRFRKWVPLVSLVLIQYGLVLYAVGKTANIMLNPVDDIDYYNIACQLARLDFSGKWKYTIGLPLFYVPFAWISGGAPFSVMHVPLALFNALLVMPVLLCMAYLVLRKISSEKTALFTLLLWFGMILFYHYRYYHSGGEMELDTYMMKSFPALPTLSFSFSLYELYVFLGYNAVSDTLSCALIFSCLAAVLYMKNTLPNLALSAMLFGLSCLVRLNNILFVPLLGFILYLRYADNLRTPWEWMRFLAAGAIPFLLVIGCQLVVNQIQLGGFWISPYTLHRYQNASRGFMMSMMPFGIRFLGLTNHAYLVIGGLSLLFVPNRRIRVLLTLWTVPLVLFFYGYPVIFTNATRFILPAFFGFIAALLMTGFFHSPVSVCIRIAAVLLGSVLLTAPAGSEQLSHLLPWNWNLLGMSPVSAGKICWTVIFLSVAILLSFLRDWCRSASPEHRREILRITVFLSGFIILFFVANPYLTALLLLASLVRTFYDAAQEIRIWKSAR